MRRCHYLLIVLTLLLTGVMSNPANAQCRRIRQVRPLFSYRGSASRVFQNRSTCQPQCVRACPPRNEIVIAHHPNYSSPLPVQATPSLANSPNQPSNRKPLVSFNGKEFPKDWVVTQYGGEGDIEVADGKIGYEIGQGLTGIHWDTKQFPKDDFEFIVRARRITGEDMTCGLTFPIGKEFASLIVGGWGGSIVGISCIDGKPADENDTTKILQLKHKQWYTVKVVVNAGKLKCWVDQQLVVDVTTKGKEFSLRGDCESSQPFSVFTFGTCIEVDQLEIRSLKQK